MSIVPKATDLHPDFNKGHQGPAFPYRFSFDTSLLRRHAPHINRWEIFCRWSVGSRRPFMVLTRKVDELTRVLTPGMVYTGTIAGHGWYSAPPGTEFLIRIVTNPEDVELLRAEAAVYELYEATWTNSETFKSLKNLAPPLQFHGFFQNGTGSAAVIILTLQTSRR